MSPVKRPNKRTERARQTRRKIVEAARTLFVERGYGATTLQEVAEHAGVAVQTIYYVFGSKRQLFKELVDTTIAGDDEPVATMDRPWFQEAQQARTAAELLRGHVNGTRRILDRVAPIMPLITVAGATDPEIADLWPTQDDPRYTVQHAAAEGLVAAPDARADLTAGTAADVLYGLLSPELYLTFVRDRGWSPQQWEEWVYDLLCRELCRPEADA